MFKTTCFNAILYLIAFFSTTFTTEIKTENGIIPLNEANFETALARKDVLLVLFESNICQGCTELKFKLSAAAALLSDNQRVGLALVNSTASPSLASRVGAATDATSPELKLFKPRTAPAPQDYAGPLDTAEAVADHLRSIAASEADSVPRRLTEANLTDALAQHANWLVAFVDAASPSSLDYALEGLKSASLEFRRGNQLVAFGYADARGNEEAMAKRLGLSTDSLPVFALLQREEPNWAITFSHPPSGANLAKFIRAHTTASGAQLRAEASRVYKTTEPLDYLNGGLDAHLVASEAAAEPVRRFLAAFLIESGFFFDRRLEGGLLAAPAAQQLGMSPDAIYVRLSQKLLTSGEPGMVRYPGPLHSSPSLKAFFDRRSLPRLGLLAWHTRHAYMSAAGRSVCLFFTSLAGGWHGEAGLAARRIHAKLAAMIAGREELALFAIASEEQESTESARFGFDESSSDVNLGCYDAARRLFAMPESDGPERAVVQQFLDSFAAGKAVQRLRSSSVPLTGAGQLHTANADRLNQLIKNAATEGGKILLIQCDFSTQPCGQSIKEFAAAAAAAAAKADSPDYSMVQFVRVDTKFIDLPGELYYRFEGDSAIELSSKQPQVLLLTPGQSAVDQLNLIRYERDAVAKEYLLEFLAANKKRDKVIRQEL